MPIFEVQPQPQDENQPKRKNPFLGIGLDDGPNLATAAVNAAQYKPDGLAHAQGLSRKLGVPADVLARNPEDAARLDLQHRLDGIRAKNPDLASWLVQGDNLALTQDDLDATESLSSKMGRLWKAPSDAQRAIVGGLVGDGLGSGLVGIGRLGEAAGRNLQSQDEEQSDTGSEILGMLLEKVGGAVQGGGDQIKAWGDVIKPPKERQNFLTDVAGGIGQVGGYMLAPEAALPMMLGQGADIAGTRAEKAGATQAQTDTATVEGAIVTAASEKALGLVGKFGLDKIPFFNKLLEKYSGRITHGVAGALEEGTQEVVEGVGHDAIAQQYDPTAKLGSGAFNDFTVAGTVGFLVKAAMHAPKLRKLATETDNASTLEALQKVLSEAKISQRPEALASLIAHLEANNGTKEAYIGAEDFIGLYQSEREAYTAAAELTGDSEALHEALAANGDLVIPLAKYVPLLATAIGPQVVAKSKLNPDHTTVEETRSVDREAAVNEFMQAWQDAQTNQPEVQPTDAAYQSIYGELIGTGRYSPGDAEHMAKLLPRLYSSMATLNGRTVEQVQAKYPVTVLSDSIGDRLRRVNPTAESLGVTPILEAIRTGKIPSQREAYGPSLVDELVKAGGVVDAGGELRSFDAIKQRPGLVNANGLELDKALTLAQELGFINPNPDDATATAEINDLLDLIDQDLRGDGVFRDQPVNKDLAGIRKNALDWQEQLPSLLMEGETIQDLMALSNQEILERARKAVSEALEQGPQEYGIAHRPPGPGSGAPAHDLTGDGQVYPDDVYGSNAARYYGHGLPGMDWQTIAILHSLRGKPNAKVTIYRAVAKSITRSERIAEIEQQKRDILKRGAKAYPNLSYDQLSKELDNLRSLPEESSPQKIEINAGDWVTVNRAYAKEHGAGQFDGKYRILSKTVKASEIFTNGDSIHEFGYWPGGKSFDQSPITQTPAFRKWFGDSKVVDAKGEPLVVYHASPIKDLTEFSEAIAKGDDSAGLFSHIGLFLSRSPKISYAYSAYGESPHAVYVRGNLFRPRQQINDAIAERFLNSYHGADIADDLDAQGLSKEQAIEKISGEITDGELKEIYELLESEEFVSFLVDEGFEGVDTGGNLLVFSPATQIKSATGNNGNFALNNLSILEQPAGGAGKAPRGAIQFPRAGIGNGASLIRLAQTADQTTFLHEMGHLFLEVMANEAGAVDANPKLAGEMQKVLDWFGVKDVATWHALGLEGQRQYHEQFARGFEQYLGEGVAPARGLRTAFRRFKTWIVGVYSDLKALNVNLTPEIRGVFDRLLATEAEIAEAQQDAAFQPALPVDEARKLGMSEAAIAKYQQALEKAKESLGAKLLRAKFRETKAWYRAQVRAMREIVRAEAEAMPVYRVLAALKAKDGGLKLDKAEIARRHGDGILTRLRGLYAVEGGQSLDLVADAHGFASGDAMLTAILNAKPLTEYVKGEADARVREQHGDPLTDGTAPNLAMQALHNSRMAGALQAEIDLLAKLANQPTDPPGAIREAARRIIAKQTVRALRPHQHLAAERKAANAAAKAAAAGKYAEALAAKRQQALNAALYAEARGAESTLERFQKHVRLLSKGPAQQRLAAAKGGYLDRVNEILHAYSFRDLSAKEVRRRESLRNWVDALQADGEVTAVSEKLLARVESERQVNWRDLPVSDVMDLRETIRNIEHLASLKNKLLAGARKATKDAAIAEMLTRADQVLGENAAPEVVDDNDLTTAQRVNAARKGALDRLTRPENIIEMLDGGESGPWHDFLWAPQVKAEETKLSLMKRVGAKLKALHAGLSPDFWENTRQTVEFKGQRMNRYTLLSAAFNMGNAGNRQRVRDGGISTSHGKVLRLTDADLPAILAMLTEEQAHYIQGVWDAVDSLRPDIEALTQRMGAVPVAFVEALPISFTSADGKAVTLRGGYWPLAYHHDRSAVGERQEGDDALKILMQAGASRAATSKGYTKGRVDELSAPLLLNFGSVLSRSLDQVMTDVAYRESVRDTSMLLRDPGVKSYLIGRMGRGVYDALNGGVAYSVSAGADVAGLVARDWRAGMDWLLANGTVSALAIRPDIALGNYASALVQGLDRVQGRSLLRGLRGLYMNRANLTEEIVALSPFMDNRLNEIDASYQKALETSRDRRGYRAAYFRLMMTLHRWADHDVVRAVWWGRYTQERAAGTDLKEAVRLADKAIRQTQTATGKKDVSTFERDPAFRQTRQFMGPMFVIFGRLRAAAAGTGNTRAVGQRAFSLMLQWGLAPAIFALAAGRAPDDDDDDGQWGVGEWARWMAVECGMFPLQTIPVVRELEAVAEGAVSDKPVSPRASPTAQAAGNMAKASRGLVKNLEDKGDDGIEWDDMTRDLITFAGPLTGAPSSQYRKTDKAVDALMDDPDKNAMELTEMALYGKPVYSKPDE